MSQNPIKAIVFDVGNVLLPLDWQQVQHSLNLSHELFKKLLFELQTWELHHRYERGEVPTLEFLKGINDKWGFVKSDKELIAGWNSFVGDVFPEMEVCLRDLKKRHKIYALSNINELHLEHVLTRNPVLSEFNKFFASHLMGARKPESRIYQKLISEIGVQPDECLFFDDNEDNINAAKKEGIRAYLIKKPPTEILQILRSLDL